MGSMACGRGILTAAVILVTGCARAAWGQHGPQGALVPISNLAAPRPLPKPSLVLQGGPLLLSDSPEQFKKLALLPAAMYRDKVMGGFRVFYHHQNESPKTLSVGIAITNTSNQPELLFTRGAGESINEAPDLAGQAAAASFISTRRSIRFTTLLPPGKSYYRVQRLPHDDTASAIVEYLLIADPGSKGSSSLPPDLLEKFVSTTDGSDQPLASAGFSLGAATVSTVAYVGDPPFDPASLPVLPPDSHIRGTFAHSDRSGILAVSSEEGLRSLSIDTSAPGKKYSNPMPNEYEPGVDAVDDAAQVYNDGNYGVVYTFRVAAPRADRSRAMELLLQPSGGSGHYLAFVDDREELSPYVTYKSAWQFGKISLRDATMKFGLQITLPGGAAGPQELLLNFSSAGR